MTTILFFIAFTTFFFVGINMLPNIEPLSNGFVTSFSTIAGQIKAWDEIFTFISTLFALVAIIVLFDITLWGFKWIMKIIHIVRGSGSSGGA